MKLSIIPVLMTAVLGLAACGKEAADSETKVPVVVNEAKSNTAAAPAVAANEQAPVAADAQAPKREETEEVTEQVAETEEAADQKDEPVAKGGAPLKLAQLPPRVPAGSKFKEGVNYLRLSPAQPVNVSPDQVQIVEFFWYGCPHCNAIDPRIEAWRKSTQPGGKPEYVVFTRVPGTWSDIARFHGRFFYAAESLGKLEELHSLIFREIHENNNPLNTVDKAREFFAAHGVDAQSFQKNFGAMSLERKLDDANTFAQRSRVTGVPTFVVNGKFTLDVGTAGGEEQVFALLNELAAREHGAR